MKVVRAKATSRTTCCTTATGGQAAYELEFPDGGLAVVIGNIIGQSSTTTNPVAEASATTVCSLK